MELLGLPTITQRVFPVRLIWPVRLAGLCALVLAAILLLRGLFPGLEISDSNGYYSHRATIGDRILILMWVPLLGAIGGLYYGRTEVLIDTGTREVISRARAWRYKLWESREKLECFTHVEILTSSGRLGPLECSYHHVHLAAPENKSVWLGSFLATGLHRKTLFISHDNALSQARARAEEIAEILKLEVKSQLALEATASPEPKHIDEHANPPQ